LQGLPFFKHFRKQQASCFGFVKLHITENTTDSTKTVSNFPGCHYIKIIDSSIRRSAATSSSCKGGNQQWRRGGEDPF
jgi:hypothetical protein